MDGPISMRLAQDPSYPLTTTLQQECTRASCPETKAGEWLYLCVARGNDGAMEVCFRSQYYIYHRPDFLLFPLGSLVAL